MHNDTAPTADEVEALRVAAARPDATNQDYFAWTTARDEYEAALDSYYEGDDDEAEDFDDEPYLDDMTEFDTAMASAGWGTDEDYGYYGGEDY